MIIRSHSGIRKCSAYATIPGRKSSGRDQKTWNISQCLLSPKSPRTFHYFESGYATWSYGSILDSWNYPDLYETSIRNVICIQRVRKRSITGNPDMRRNYLVPFRTPEIIRIYTKYSERDLYPKSPKTFHYWKSGYEAGIKWSRSGLLKLSENAGESCQISSGYCPDISRNGPDPDVYKHRNVRKWHPFAQCILDSFSSWSFNLVKAFVMTVYEEPATDDIRIRLSTPF